MIIILFMKFKIVSMISNQSKISFLPEASYRPPYPAEPTDAFHCTQSSVRPEAVAMRRSTYIRRRNSAPVVFLSSRTSSLSKLKHSCSRPMTIFGGDRLVVSQSVRLAADDGCPPKAPVSVHLSETYRSTLYSVPIVLRIVNVQVSITNTTWLTAQHPIVLNVACYAAPRNCWSHGEESLVQMVG